jgi:predicted GH43/DUF377 family glycosyl hydrolase
MGNKELIFTVLIILLTKQCLSQSYDKRTSGAEVNKENLETLNYSELEVVSKNSNPILKPEGTGFESKAVYNPTVIVNDSTINMIYRAEGKETGTGVLALAFSKCGKSFERYECNPIIRPAFDYETFGCEDPRVVKINNVFYLTYVGNDHGRTPGDICLATSEDFIKWEKHGEIMQPSHDWNKSKIKAGVIVPEKINGKYIMYFLGEKKTWETSIGIAFSEDLIRWKELVDKPVIVPRKGYFDSKGIEPGATPIIMKNGILLIYNGWDEKHVHKTGWVLFSKEDPTKVIERCKKPIIEPELDFEKKGFAENVTFAEGIIFFKGIWYLYYGAADKYIGLVTIRNFERLFQQF